jgi:hypothetical protein
MTNVSPAPAATAGVKTFFRTSPTAAFVGGYAAMFPIHFQGVLMASAPWRATRIDTIVTDFTKTVASRRFAN